MKNIREKTNKAKKANGFTEKQNNPKDNLKPDFSITQDNQNITKTLPNENVNEKLHKAELELIAEWLKTCETIEAKRAIGKDTFVKKAMEVLDEEIVDALKGTYENDVLHSIAKSIKLLFINPYYFKTSTTQTKKYDYNEELYQRFLEMQDYYIKEGEGVLFSPELATNLYKVDFMSLKFDRHYKTTFSAIIGANGASPSINIHFTNEGIKELIGTNSQIRQKIEDEWINYVECLEDGHPSIVEYGGDKR